MLKRIPDTIRYYRDECFSEHEAKLKTADINGEAIIILDWRNPNSRHYAMRFLFERNFIIVTGDLGEAVFELTELAEPARVAKYDITYLHSKLRCSSEGTADFCGDYALDEIKDNLDMGNGESDKRSLVYQRLRNEARKASSQRYWNDALNSMSEELCELDEFWAEWMPYCGDVYTNQMEAILLGIRMAVEQLNLTK